MTPLLRRVLAPLVMLAITGAAAIVPAPPAQAAAPLVALDPGHGGRFSGAVNYNYSFAGKPYMAESDVNLDITLRADAAIRALGFRTVLTRTEDTEALTPMRDIATWNLDPDGVFRFYADGKTDLKDDLQARVNIANCGRQDPSCSGGDPSEASVFISIHNNSCCGGDGTETYNFPGSTRGGELASLIQSEVVSRIARRNRGVKEASFYVLRWTRMAAALLEAVFLDNDQEAQLLLDPAFRQLIAEGVAAAVARYFGALQLVVPPSGRASISVGSLPGWNSTDVSAEVTSDQPVVAERSVYFVAPPNGGTGSGGARAASATWYFAEGATHSGFVTFLLIYNPSETTADITLSFIDGRGSPAAPVSVQLGPARRRTISLNQLAPEADLGAVISSTAPVVAERAMYSSGAAGEAHVSPGATALSQTWYFAEGYTGSGFYTFLILANPGAESAQATIEFLAEAGQQITPAAIAIPPGQRRTLLVNNISSGIGIGAAITSDRPIVAERSVYQEFPQKAATNVVGAPSPSTSWYFAEGATHSGFSTFLLIANPGEQDAAVEIHLASPGLPQPILVAYLVPARSRITVSVNAILPGADVSAKILSTNGVPIVAERAMYFAGAATGGHGSLGAAAPSAAWYFAEGFTGPGFSTFLLVYNPGSTPANVSVRLRRP